MSPEKAEELEKVCPEESSIDSIYRQSSAAWSLVAHLLPSDLDGEHNQVNFLRFLQSEHDVSDQNNKAEFVRWLEIQIDILGGSIE